MLATIQAIFTDPHFLVQGPLDHAAHGQVAAGIRQGCPRSPYLLIIVLTVMLSDVDTDLLTQGVPCNTWSTPDL